MKEIAENNKEYKYYTLGLLKFGLLKTRNLLKFGLFFYCLIYLTYSKNTFKCCFLGQQQTMADSNHK